MNYFIEQLQFRNGPLFIFGSVNLCAAVLFILLTRYSNTIVKGVNAWYKPFKFAMSIGIFSWTMGWLCYELHLPGTVMLYSWVTIVLLGFEMVYIAFQAGRGQLSHYNSSSPLYLFLFQMMGLAITIVTLWTGYIGLLFISTDSPDLPDYYLLSIRIAIVLFVIFSFEGAIMGAKSAHTVGGPDGGPGLPVLKWSTTFGDLRIAHFIGMHALQVLPVLSWFVLKNTAATAFMGLLYTALALYTLVRALQGRAFNKFNYQVK
jgi:hypothetical protein